MDALTARLRDGGDPENTFEQWHTARSEEAIKKMQEMGVNVVIINFHKGFGLKAEAEDIATTRMFTRIAHQYGLKVIGYVGGTLMYETLFREEPEARHWMQVDEFGHPVYYNDDQTFRYAACRNTAGYLTFIKKVVRLGIEDMKLDGIHFDQMMWWPEPQACRDSSCREQFRAYLRERYSDARQARLRFGFSDFEGIMPPPYDLQAPPVRLPELHNPLMQEWTRFHAMSLAERCGELGNYIHALNPRATMIYNPAMNLESNVGFMYGVDPQQLFLHGDGVWSEEPNLPQWTSDGRLVSRIRSYKAARAMGQTLFTWQRYTGDPAFEQGPPAVLRLAESLAYNDANLGVLAGADAGGNEAPPEMQRYIRFFGSHLQDLVRTTTVADAVVLRSFSSVEFNPSQSNFSTVLFEQTLIQGKIPFGIVFDRHLKDLGKYKVLVLANQDALSDEQIGDIQKFVEDGGGLVATENTSLLTDWRTARDKFGLSELFGTNSPPGKEEPNKPVQRRFGKGRVVYIPRIEAATAPPPALMNSTIGNELWKLPKNNADLVEAVKWAAGNRLSATVDAPLWVTMELAEQESSHTRLLHLINFKFQEPVKDIPVGLRIPEGFRLREAVLETPDGELSRRLSASGREGLVSLRIPQLAVYDLILLRMEKQ
jgi:hypothetical protein